MNKSVKEAAPNRRSLAWRRLTAGTVASFTLLSLTESSDGIVPNLPTGTKIVAMGDSYTSGHNNGDVQGKFNECFRDNVSYAYKIADQLDLLDSFTNVACSGATPEEIIEGRFDERPQIEALDDETDYVLLTTGANAANLSELLGSCLESDCSVGSHHITVLLNYVSSEAFIDRLRNTYQKIAQHAPNAAIIVTAYPTIIDTGAICGELAGNGVDGSAEAAIDTLNRSIETAVQSARNEGLMVFLSPPATDIDLCRTLGQSFFHDPENPRAMGHPTDIGHRAIAKSVLGTMAAANYTLGYNDSSEGTHMLKATGRR